MGFVTITKDLLALLDPLPGVGRQATGLVTITKDLLALRGPGRGTAALTKLKKATAYLSRTQRRLEREA